MLRGFVIQFDEISESEPVRFVGRVEHVDSGRAKRFNSLTELVSFLEHVKGDFPLQDVETKDRQATD